MGILSQGKRLNLIKTPDYEGYLLEDIEKELGKGAQKFWDWFAGQTGAIHEGKLLVFKWDYERYLAGLPPLD